MRAFIALLLGLIIGGAVAWYYANHRGNPDLRAAQDKVSDAAKSARDTIQDQLRGLNLRPDDIKDELARTGQVIRRKAHEAGQVIACTAFAYFFCTQALSEGPPPGE